MYGGTALPNQSRKMYEVVASKPLAQARCPKCNKLLGCEVSGATIRCGRCKDDIRFRLTS